MSFLTPECGPSDALTKGRNIAPLPLRAPDDALRIDVCERRSEEDNVVAVPQRVAADRKCTSADGDATMAIRETMNFSRSKELQQKSHRLIPGGAHTYSKGDDQYPEESPGFIARGAGCHVWDVDGNEFIEYGAGSRAVTLGHAYPSVVEAASRAMGLGINFVRPTTLEVELAEKMLSLIPSGQMVKFGKNGSDVTTAALKLARACTGRDMVARCGDQPFLSVDDWFMAAPRWARACRKPSRT